MLVEGKGTLNKNQYGWSISDNQKQQDGTYNNFYIPVYLKKDLQEPNDKTFVSIKGFTKPYKTKDGKTGMSYFIMDYEEIGNTAKEKTDTEIINEVANDPFNEFSLENQEELENSLPF